MHKLFAAVVVSLALVGCGRPIDHFVGMWSSSGTASMTFNTPEGPQTFTEPLSGNTSVLEGVDSDIIITMGDCAVPANVDGDLATIRSGYSCVSNGGTGSTTMTFSNGTVTANKSTMTLTSSGTVTIVANGQTITGTFQLTGTLTRLGK